MHDPVEIRRRIDRLLALLSRRDDYGELLANGHVVGQVEDADAWRAAIRAHARADRIEVQTGADRCAVYALLIRRPDDDTDDDEYMAALKEMAATAAALRHEPALIARHGPEILISCDRCPALGYGRCRGSRHRRQPPRYRLPQRGGTAGDAAQLLMGALVVRLPCRGTEAAGLPSR
jgi:hypothetical protein